MAYRVQTQEKINFGVMSAEKTASHVRFSRSGFDSVTLALTASITVPSGDRMIISSGMFDIVYKSGALPDAHIQDLINPFWDGEDVMLDMMSDSTTVVDDSGYSQQTYSNWSITQESD